MFILRKYQQDAVDATLKKFETDRYALIDIFVGSGKSLILTKIASYYNKVIICSPSMELVVQNFSKLQNFNISNKIPTMIDSAHKGDWNADFIYTTIQTLSKHLNDVEEPDLLIIDELDMMYNGKMHIKIFDKWVKCKVCGLTATPFYTEITTKIDKDKDGDLSLYSISTIKSIAEDKFNLPVISISREMGYKLGYGCKIIKNKIDIPRLVGKYIKDIENPDSYIIFYLKKLYEFLSTIKGQGIIYTDSKKHSELISKYFSIPTCFGDTPIKERIKLIEDFKNGKIKFITSVGCLRVGFDMPSLKNIIILCNINDCCLAEQTIGRINRTLNNNGPNDPENVKYVWYNSNLNIEVPIHNNFTSMKIDKLKDLRNKKKIKK